MGLTRRQLQIKAMVRARQSSNIQSLPVASLNNQEITEKPELAPGRRVPASEEGLDSGSFSESCSSSDTDSTHAGSLSGEESEDDIIIEDSEPFNALDTVTAKTMFNSLFNNSSQAQKRGAASLPGLKGRAGNGDSSRNKRRKAAGEKQLAKENSLCVPVNRMFERQLEIEANSNTPAAAAPLLPSLKEERRAVITASDGKERHQRLLKAIEVLSKRLWLESVRREENLEGQWRKRHEMVLNFMHYRVKFPEISNGQAAIQVAGTFLRGFYVARRLIEWTECWINNRTIPRGECGIYRRMSTWYEDESLLLFIREFITKSKDKLTSHTLSDAVGDYLHSNEHHARIQDDLLLLSRDDGEHDRNSESGPGHVYKKSSIRARTARRWLLKLGLNYNDVRKGVYIDGHDRNDVLEYRISFIQRLDELQPRLIEFDENGTPIDKAAPPEGLKKIILCTHDESIFSANDSRRKTWMNSQNTNSFLRKNPKDEE